MIRHLTRSKRAGSRRPRPPRFPVPGFPRGAGRRRFPARRRGQGRSPRRPRGWAGDLLAVAATLAGIVLWGGLLALLA
jgi:hypothetical protein